MKKRGNGIRLKTRGKISQMLWIIFIPLMASTAAAQLLSTTSQPDKSTQTAAEDPLGRSTPYGTISGFVMATHREDYALAAQYLDTRKQGTAAQELAKQLLTVLDRGLMNNLDKISRKPEGNQQDGLRSTRDLVGVVDAPTGELEIFLDHVDRRGEGPIWLFASESLARIPDAAAKMDSYDIENHLPRGLVRTRILSLPLYRWILLILALTVALGLGSLITRALVPLLRLPLRRLTGEADDRALASVKSPIRLVLISAVISFFPRLALSLYMRQFWIRVGSIVAIIGFSWLLIQFIDILFELYTRRLRNRQMLGKVAMWGLFSRMFKAMVVIAAALVLLHLSGSDLTAVLTGLGVGGIAVALAAQKTLENLFGGIMIISDEPMRVGDFCRIADQMGTIEDIGLRSTRIRTLSRTVVAIPNGQLATMNVENFSVRDKFWLRHMIGLRYETSADQLRYVLAEIRKMLYAHPKVDSDGARIRFVGFGSFSLDLEIFAYVRATQMPEFLTIQEDLLLRIMDIIAKSGTGIAFPSQTTYLGRDQQPDSQKTQAAEMQVRRWRETGEFPFPEFQLDQVNLMSDRNF